MENIAEKLNLVIEYIESHLTENIEPKEIEKLVQCPFYDVSRSFYLISGINISDYVRKRRLTLAGTELKSGNIKVIDVALKYGYNSPISFARAFKSFHGFNPSSASKNNTILSVFPRLAYQICVESVIDVISNEKITINGKEYEASYFGEQDMSTWSYAFIKRKYWRLEDAYEDFKNKPKLEQVLPYNNYPPINIKIGQVFVLDYYNQDGRVERKFYISDGTIWHDMACTREFIPDFLVPIRKDKITVAGVEYNASYFGEQDMHEWSEYATKREFWRLENTKNKFRKYEKLVDILPYNNYPPVKIKIGDIFVIDYHTRKGAIERKYYVADGTIWRNMQSTRQIIVNDE